MKIRTKKLKPRVTDVIGWREWIALPELGVKQIKAKIDTGARTSALHAFSIEPINKRGVPKIRFAIHPLQHNDSFIVHCEAELVDCRYITDSGGHREKRWVIVTPVTLGDMTWPIELTLTNRDAMTFRMLLGRAALKGRYSVDPQHSYLHGKRIKL